MIKLILVVILGGFWMSAQALTLVPENINTNTNTNLPTAVAGATAGAAASAIQGQGQGQLQGQGQMQGNVGVISNDVRNRAVSASGGNTLTVNEAAIPAATSQNIRMSDYTVKNVPNVLSGSVYPTAPCMGSSQAGGSGVGFGVSFGTSWTDDECGIRETARSFAGMGMREDAIHILCASKYAAIAPVCQEIAPKAE